MLLSRLPLSAHSQRQRPRLFTPLAVLLMGGVAAVLMVLLFPRDQLRRDLLSQQQPDSLTALYLQAHLRYEPQNEAMRLALARVQLALRETAAARRTLVFLLKSADPRLREEARWMSYEVDLQTLYAWPNGSSDRAAARGELLARLKRDFPELQPDNPHFHSYTNLVWRLDAPDLAKQAYAAALAEPTKVGSDWLRVGARTALGQSDYLLAAQMYFAARRVTYDYAQSRQDYLDALAVLQAGNLLQEALTLGAQQLEGFSRDTVVLERLTRLAMAANRPDLAEEYARRMLRLSMRWQGRIRLVSQQGGMPFNERQYRLGYDAFLANGNVADALKVARLAVAQVPGDLVWRKRLAQVAEWSGEPALALQEWLYLARTTGEELAWQGVLRLAPGLFEYDALLLALEHQLQQRPGDPVLWREYVRLAEELGRPAVALARLRQALSSGKKNEALYLMAAELAERSGDLSAALAVWQTLRQHHGPRPQWAVREASIHYAQGDAQTAMIVLRQASAEAAKQDVLFWQVYSGLALTEGMEAEATLALQQLRGTGEARAIDLRNLAVLLKSQHPIEAAAVAAEGWQRHGEETDLLMALQLYQQEGEITSLKRLLEAVSASQLQSLQRMPTFLAARAGYYELTQQPRLALQDYELALRIEPGNGPVRLAYLWLLNNQEDVPRLRNWLAQWEAASVDDGRYMQALAAANLLVDRPARALAYYKTTPREQRSYLWWMGVADALDQSGSPDAAMQARYRAWHSARTGKPVVAIEKGQVLTLQMRFAILRAKPDQVRPLLREMLRLDDTRGSAQVEPASVSQLNKVRYDAARELALAAWLDRENYSAAQAFLLTRYANWLERPAYAEILAALGQMDGEKLDFLLERGDVRLPVLSKMVAQRELGQRTAAQTDGFDVMQTLSAHDGVQDMTREVLLEGAEIAAAEFGRFENTLLSSDIRSAGASLNVTPRLKVHADWQAESLRIKDFNAVPELTGRIEQGKLGLVLETGYGYVDADLLGTKAVHDFTGLHLQWRPLRQRNGFTSLYIDHNTVSNDSTLLRVAGMQDEIGTRFSWRIDKQTALNLAASQSRYFSQNGSYLGRGTGVDWELAYTARREFPEWNARLYGAAKQYQADGNYDCADASQLVELIRNDPVRYQLLGQNLTAALKGLPANILCGASMGQVNPVLAYIPASYQLYGVSAGWNESLLNLYSKAWRPLAAISFSHHSVFGTGLGGVAGFAGSVWGGDKLLIYTQALRGADGGQEKRWVMRYEWYF